MITYYQTNKGKQGIQKETSHKKGSWVKVVSPTPEEVKFLDDKFDLDEVLINDALDPNEVPRIEKEGSNIYIYLRIPKTNLEDEPTVTLSIIITPEDIVTISSKEIKLYEILEQTKKFDVADTEKFMLTTLKYIFRNYNENVRKILKEVKKDRRNILKLKNKDILDLVLQEDILNEYISSLYPMISMYDKILKLKVLRLDSDEKEEIEDLIVDLNQTFDTCKSVRQTITNMRDYYSTTVSNKINDSITILTIFTVFLTIPAVISSIYGMNISLPFQNKAYIFFILLGIVLFIWAILFKFFKKLVN